VGEAVWIGRVGRMDRDDGSYQLWDKLLTDVRNRKSVLVKISDQRSKRR